MRFSIVIPTKNRPEELKKIFASIMIQTKLPDQIVIIDQSSRDKIIKNELKAVLKNKKIELNYLCNNKKSDVYVHTWGGPVSMLANYHVAIANEGKMAEWPMPKYHIRNELVKNPWKILNGKLIISDQPGLGIYLIKFIQGLLCVYAPCRCLRFHPEICFLLLP